MKKEGLGGGKKNMCAWGTSNSNCQLYQERTRVEGQRIERLNKSDIKNKPIGEKWKILWKKVSSVVLVILTKHDITGRRARDKERQQKADRTERGQSESEKKNKEWGPKNKKKETCENNSTKNELRSLYRWRCEVWEDTLHLKHPWLLYLQTAGGALSPLHLSSSAIPPSTHGMTPSCPCGHRTLVIALSPWLQMSLIREPDAVLARLEPSETCSNNFAHTHTLPVKCRGEVDAVKSASCRHFP